MLRWARMNLYRNGIIDILKMIGTVANDSKPSQID